jgi:hypothetical protein
MVQIRRRRSHRRNRRSAGRARSADWGVVLTSLAAVFLLVVAMNARSLLADRSVEITTFAALIVNYVLGV